MQPNRAFDAVVTTQQPQQDSIQPLSAAELEVIGGGICVDNNI